MKVSICVAQYNRADRVQESIGSLLNQEFDDYEVIVVNDGSSDPLVKVYLDNIVHPKLTVIHQDNTGFVGAMRKAIETARGNYIAIHGAGDISLPKRVAAQSQFLDLNENVGAVGCFYQNCTFSENKTEVINIKQNSKNKLTANDFIHNPIPFGHGEVMYRKALYQKVGGYRSFFRFAQDHDLWLRMIEHCEMALVPEILYQRGYFQADGIATNIDKLIVQKLLSHFAIQLYKDRKKNKPDLVELHGPQAGLFRAPSKDLAKFLSWKALSLFYQGQSSKARELMLLSLKENRSIKNTIIEIFIVIGSQKTVRKYFIQLMKKHPRSEKWSG